MSDGCTAWSGFLINGANYAISLIASRSTNNDEYGIGISATTTYIDYFYEDWCVLYNNTDGARAAGIPDGPRSDDNPSSDGYVDAANDDYNIEIGAEIRSEAWVVNWDGV